MSGKPLSIYIYLDLIYDRFGSVVVDDPAEMTRKYFGVDLHSHSRNCCRNHI